MTTLRGFLEENGWVRSVIALGMVATWIATIFTRIALDETSQTFISMVIAFYFARALEKKGA